MIQRYYSVYDRKALVYNPPYLAVNEATAIRMLADAVADPQTSLARHPGDYVLYCIGEYDDGKGSLTPYSPLVHVVDATALVAPVQTDFFGIPPKGDKRGDELANGEDR